MSGWIKLHRKIKEHWIWQEKPFDKRSAWLDLIMMVNHQDNKVLNGRSLIEVERGSCITSEVKLSERWGWSRKKVRIFLEVLQSEKMLTKKSTTKYTVISIDNYDLYQERGTTEEQQKNNRRTTEEQQKNTNKNEKNDKNEKNIYTEFVEAFNLICPELPKVIKLTDKRKSHINARMQYLKTMGAVEDYFKKVAVSKFLNGDSDNGWKADFDWLINENNMIKVLEGKYDNKDYIKPPPSKLYVVDSS